MGRASPAKMEHRKDGNTPGLSIFMRSMMQAIEGTANQMVRAGSRMNFAGPSSCVLGTTWRDAPAAQVTNMSRTELSNVISATCDTRSWGRNAHLSCTTLQY